MSLDIDRHLTFGRVAGIVEDEAGHRDRISVFLEIAGIQPLDGLSLPIDKFGQLAVERGAEVLVEITRGVTEEGELHPRLIL